MLKFWLVVSRGKFCLCEKAVRKKCLQGFVSLDYFRGTNRSISKFLNNSGRFLVVAAALIDDDSTLVDSKNGIYGVSQEECARLQESVPYVKVYRYNPKHLYPKLNGYGDNGQRKVGASCGSKYCNLHS